MIVDTSAVVAIILDEPEARSFKEAIADASIRWISAGNWLEAAMVVESRGDPVAARRFDDLLLTLKIDVRPVTVEQATLARRAFQRFGRGRHPARLNFGDCFAYALAAADNDELLFKGDDFSQTDIRPALKD